MNTRLAIVGSVFAFSSVAAAQQAVQWKVSDGGNGHWYALGENFASGAAARTQAEQLGGTLLMLNTIAEQEFCLSLPGFPVGNNGVWLGMRLQLNGWFWDDGSEVTGISWCPGNPCTPCDEPAALLLKFSEWGTGVADSSDPHCCFPFPQTMIEWSADCNSDGFVDYGQILAGQLADTDENGVPDVCEVDPCPGDVNSSGVVNAVDISVILSAWGTNGGKFPRADTDGSGVVDAADLSVVLGGWGKCP